MGQQEGNFGTILVIQKHEKWENHRVLWLVAQFRGCSREKRPFELGLHTWFAIKKIARYKFPDKPTVAS